jgi:hypothetical protein
MTLLDDSSEQNDVLYRSYHRSSGHFRISNEDFDVIVEYFRILRQWQVEKKLV